MAKWLNQHWVPAALCVAIAMTLLMPFLAARWSLPQMLTFALLPTYMFHQVEEHTGDRFRQFVNQKVFGGVEGLTPLAVLWINLPGVWGVGLLSICATVFGAAGWGLSMLYLTLVNAVAHIVAAAVWHQYNPGLWTSLSLFIPLGAWALWRVSTEPGVHWIHQIIGIAVALGIHAAIIVHTRRHATRAAALRRATE